LQETSIAALAIAAERWQKIFMMTLPVFSGTVSHLVLKEGFYWQWADILESCFFLGEEKG